MRRTVIAGLLLVASATTALAADPAAGEKIFKAQCGICHAVAAGENRVGPTPFGVVGRPAGSVPGFNYTADHKKLGIAWDAATLDEYLANPRAMVPDTSMLPIKAKNSGSSRSFSNARHFHARQSAGIESSKLHILRAVVLLAAYNSQLP